jgi:hypothetical protein
MSEPKPPLDPYRVFGCALVIASILVVVAFFAQTLREMQHLFREDR